MGERQISIRVARISNEKPESNKVYSADLIELTHGVSSIYFVQIPENPLQYEMVLSQNLGLVHGRMARTGAREMHLTSEESEDVFDIIFGERDKGKISELLSGLSKRVEQAGLKGEEN